MFQDSGSNAGIRLKYFDETYSMNYFADLI